MEKFKVNEKIEILGYLDVHGHNKPVDNNGRYPDKPIWIPAMVYSVASSDILVRHPIKGSDLSLRDNLNTWMIYDYEWPRLIRREKPAPAIPMAESCFECKAVFPYPNEFNCKQGRVCYSCRSTYGWKYQFTA